MRALFLSCRLYVLKVHVCCCARFLGWSHNAVPARHTPILPGGLALHANVCCPMVVVHWTLFLVYSKAAESVSAAVLLLLGEQACSCATLIL